MFLREDIIEFINKIINMTEDEDKAKNNIEEFCNYLKLTKMIDNDTVMVIDKINECLPEIFSLRKKIGYVNITTILESLNQKTKTKVLRQRKIYIPNYEDKHYKHYHASDSTSCGTSSASCGTTSTSCGTSSRSGC